MRQRVQPSSPRPSAASRPSVAAAPHESMSRPSAAPLQATIGRRRLGRSWRRSKSTRTRSIAMGRRGSRAQVGCPCVTAGGWKAVGCLRVTAGRCAAVAAGCGEVVSGGAAVAGCAAAATWRLSLAVRSCRAHSRPSAHAMHRLAAAVPLLAALSSDPTAHSETRPPATAPEVAPVVSRRRCETPEARNPRQTERAPRRPPLAAPH